MSSGQRAPQGESAARFGFSLSYSSDLTLWLPLLFTLGCPTVCPQELEADTDCGTGSFPSGRGPRCCESCAARTLSPSPTWQSCRGTGSVCSRNLSKYTFQGGLAPDLEWLLTAFGEIFLRAVDCEADLQPTIQMKPATHCPAGPSNTSLPPKPLLLPSSHLPPRPDLMAANHQVPPSRAPLVQWPRTGRQCFSIAALPLYSSPEMISLSLGQRLVCSFLDPLQQVHKN